MARARVPIKRVGRAGEVAKADERAWGYVDAHGAPTGPRYRAHVEKDLQMHTIFPVRAPFLVQRREVAGKRYWCHVDAVLVSANAHHDGEHLAVNTAPQSGV